MKNIVLIYIICHLGTLANAQLLEEANALNMTKYWNYRYELIGDDIDPNYDKWAPGFLDLTLDPGGSLPASSQIIGTDEASSQSTVYLPFNSDVHYLRPGECANQEVYGTYPNSVGGRLTWGDAQLRYGKYLIVLATEWKLLNENHQDTREVERELFFAVEAATRLDLNGEKKYGKPGILDGFIYRDDVPQDFAFDESRFGNRFHWVSSDFSCDLLVPEHNPTCKDLFKVPVTTYGIYTYNFNGFSGIVDRTTYGEPSIDQILYYITGLYFVAKIVPNGLQYSPEPDLANIAKTQIAKSIDYLCNHGFFVINPSGKLVCRGQYAYEYASLFQKICLDLGVLQDSPCMIVATPALVQSYVAWNFMTKYYNFTGWNGPNNIPGKRWSHRMNLYMLMLDGPYASDNAIMAANVLLPMLHLGVTRRSLANWALAMGTGSDLDAFEDLTWLDVGGATLHGYYPFIPQWLYRLRMNRPEYECLRPREFADANSGWVKITRQMAFDFLLMNNLTRLSFSPYVFSYWDLARGQYVNFNPGLERVAHTTYPFGTFGDATHRLVVQSAYKLYVDAHLLPGSNVKFVAPHTDLTPPCHIQFGAVADVYNDRMRCSDMYNDNPNFGWLTDNDGANSERRMNTDSIQSALYGKDGLSEMDSLAVVAWLADVEEKYFKNTDDIRVAADLYVHDVMADINLSNEVLRSLNLPEVKDNLYLALSPNPAGEFTTATFETFEDDRYWITVIDAMGGVRKNVINGIMMSPGSQAVQIDVTDLVPGMYSVVLRNSKDQVTKKLVVQ